MTTTSPAPEAPDTDPSARPRPLPITVGARPDSAWPEAETPTTLRRTHVVALSAMLLGTAYLVWRATATLSPMSLALGLPLLVLEAWSLVTVALQSVTLWNVDAVRPPRTVSETTATVAVLIPTSDETHQVLMPTLAAATRMRLATEIIVLDDGGRPWVAGMCDELGIEYRTRIRRSGGTATQLNTVLPGIAADFVVVLAADQVADRDFIGRTLAHFDDPRVALVQTPQAYYNEDSFEHVTRGRQRYAEQTLWERVVGAGRNRLNAAFWSGGGAILRRSALASVGGVAEGTTAAGLDTSVSLHAAGWRTVHHNEILARGRGAADAAEYADRRSRAAGGAMQVLRKRRFISEKGLSVGQRASYLSTLTDWLGSWRTLGYLAIPAVALLLSLTPATGPIALFLMMFPLAFVLRQVARRALGRGQAPHGDLTVFGIIRMATTLRATFTLLTGVAPRPRSADRDPRSVPAIIVALLGLNLVAVAWGVAALTGITGITYPYIGIALGAIAWGTANVLYLARATTRVRSRHFGGDRREAQRIEVEGHVFLDGERVHVLDLSLTGVRVLSYGDVPELGTYCAMAFTDPNKRSAVVTGTVVGVQRRPHGHDVRVALEEDQTYVMGAILAEALVSQPRQ